MKIVFTHTDFRIYWPARLDALQTFLQNKGMDLFVIEISGSGSPYSFAGESKVNMPYWHCLFPDKKMEDIDPGIAKKTVIKELDKILPDVIISGPIAFPSGAAAVDWAVKNNRKIIVFDDARLENVPRTWWVDLIKKKVYSCIDAVFCPSPEWINTFRHFGFTNDQLFYGVDVVDNKFWKCANQNFSVNNSETKYFLTAGRLIAKKNFAFLIRAYERYVKVTNNPKDLVVVGDGPENELLKANSKGNDIEGRVHFYPLLSQEKLKMIYQKAGWFILPSLGETWGLVVNEAMASGLPVLVSDHAGCASTLVRNGENGFTFSPDDVEGLVKLLIRSGTMSEDERIKMGQRSEEIISEWDLGRFCSGLYDAIKYVSGTDKRNSDIAARIIIKLWKGRYRPV